jgi:ABC-type sugar transport system ATPase subunit
VVLGIRPEHLHAKPTGGEGDCCPLTVRLNVIEPLGNSMDVYVQTALKDHVVARLEAQSGLQADSSMTLYADLRRIHFFEPGEVGQNLSI